MLAKQCVDDDPIDESFYQELLITLFLYLNCKYHVRIGKFLFFCKFLLADNVISFCVVQTVNSSWY